LIVGALWSRNQANRDDQEKLGIPKADLIRIKLQVQLTKRVAQKTIVSFGEMLWDIFPEGTWLAGAPFNLAYRLNSLGERGIIASRLGRDELGRRALENALRLGLETAFLQWDDHYPTGTVRVSFDRRGNPDYYIVPGTAYDNIEADDSLVELVSAADCFCFGTLVQRSAKSRRTLELLLEAAGGGCVRFLDLNLRKDCYTGETVTSSLERADILKLNEDEAGTVSRMIFKEEQPLPDFCAKIVERYSLHCCVVTLGERGALACGKDGGKFYLSGYQVITADTVGAGDAFSAGFVHFFLQGRSLGEACRFGNIMGALAASRKGPTAPIQSREIETFAARGIEHRLDPRLKEFLLTD